jgi:hypothetical protein
MTKSKRPIFTELDRGAIRVAAAKPLIYLDSCVWIDLVEKTEDLLSQCVSLAKKGNAFFPLSFSTVHEVIEQPIAQKRARVASLMDDLSQGLCFRDSKTIHEMEANLALPVILGAAETAFHREKTLTWIVEFAGRMTLEFPPSWNDADADKFMGLMVNRTELRSVRWLVDNAPPGQMRRENVERMERFVGEMKALISRSLTEYQLLSKEMRWKRLLLDERTSIVQKIISPRMTKSLLQVVGPEMLLGTIKSISNKVGDGGVRRLDQIMKAMPSLDLYCQIMAERGRNYSRKPKAQDFFDVEHAIVGGVYSDFFVTADGNLYDLLTRQCKVSASRGCRVMRGVKGLQEILRQIVS